MCNKQLSKDSKVRIVFLHTALGTIKVKIQRLRCQHLANDINTEICNTRVGFHKYIHNNKQYFITATTPHYILVGKSHLFDMHYVKQFAVQQFLHGNGSHLLAKQANIAGQHRKTPDLIATINGCLQITPQLTANTLGDVLKIWMLLRFFATHTPQPTNVFDKQTTIQTIIHQSRNLLQDFQLRPHAPSSEYCCTEHTFILDGTCKLTFKVCSVLGCFNGIVQNKTVCSDHLVYNEANNTEITGNIVCICVCVYVCLCVCLCVFVFVFVVLCLY